MFISGFESQLLCSLGHLNHPDVALVEASEI